jgi:hypothetical protein
MNCIIDGGRKIAYFGTRQHLPAQVLQGQEQSYGTRSDYTIRRF